MSILSLLCCVNNQSSLSHRNVPPTKPLSKTLLYNSLHNAFAGKQLQLLDPGLHASTSILRVVFIITTKATLVAGIIIYGI